MLLAFLLLDSYHWFTVFQTGVPLPLPIFICLGGKVFVKKCWNVQTLEPQTCQKREWLVFLSTSPRTARPKARNKVIIATIASYSFGRDFCAGQDELQSLHRSNTDKIKELWQRKDKTSEAPYLFVVA